MARLRTKLRGVALLALILLSGCAGTEVEVLIDRADLSWPNTPEQARVRYLGSIRKLHNPSLQGFGSRLLQWIRSAPLERPILRPAGIAATATGAIYFVDQEAISLNILRPDLCIRKSIDLGSRFAGLELVDVAVAPEGDIYVSDARGGRVLHLDRQGELLAELRHSGLQRPTGLFYDEDSSQLYVVDTLGHQVFRAAPGEELEWAWGERGGEVSQLNFPVYICGERDQVWIVDSLNFRISAWSNTGEPRGVFGEHGNGPGTFARPKGIATDSDGHLYVVDALFGNVQVFDSEGTLLLRFGESGSGPGQMLLPADIAIAGDKIFVTDSHNHRIQVFEYLATAASAAEARVAPRSGSSASNER